MAQRKRREDGPPVYLVGSEKGGVGKTTICYSLALLRAMAGHLVCVVDTDSQENLAMWSTARGEQGLQPDVLCVQRFGKIGADILKLAKQYEVFVDAGGRDSLELRQAVAVARTWLLPTTPSQLDLFVMAKMQTMLIEVEQKAERAPRVLTILNAVNASTHEASEMREAMAEYERLPVAATTLGYRVAMRRAVRAGCGLMELPGKHADPIALAELHGLYAEVFGEPHVQAQA